MKWTPIMAIVCITALQCVALAYGVDGALFGLAIAAIAGLGGYQLHKARVNPK